MLLGHPSVGGGGQSAVKDYGGLLFLSQAQKIL